MKGIDIIKFNHLLNIFAYLVHLQIVQMVVELEAYFQLEVGEAEEEGEVEGHLAMVGVEG